MSQISRKVFVAAPILLLLVAPLPAVADEEDDEFDRFSISAGVFFTDRESKTQVRGTIGEGSNVDLEGDLGLDRNDVVFRLDSYYRFNERHRIDFSIFDLSRDKTVVIEEEIEWGDTVYPINARIKAEFDLAIYKLAYTWSFMRRERGYLGLTGGFYVASFGASLVKRNWVVWSPIT